MKKHDNSHSYDDDLNIDLDSLDLPDFVDTLDDSRFTNIDHTPDAESEETTAEFLDDDDFLLPPPDFSLEDGNGDVEDKEASVALSNDELESILELEPISVQSMDDTGEEAVNDMKPEITVEPIDIDAGDDADSLDSLELPLEQDYQDISMEGGETSSAESISETTEKDESDDEQPISLSDQELEDILDEMPDELEIEESDDVDNLDVAVTGIDENEEFDDEVSIPRLSEVKIDEDDESISLTPEELENIVSGEDIQELTQELQEELAQEELSGVRYDEIEDISIPEPSLEDDEEKIALTDEELTNIVNEIQEDYEEISVPEPEEFIPETVEPSAARAPLVDTLEQETGIKKEELKMIISYLDSLFDKLPDEVIKEFSRSEYFHLYKKVIETLGIYPPEN